MRSMRSLAGSAPGGLPLLSPIDQLRLELDEVWPDGARVTKDAAGRLFLPGVTRLIQGPTCRTHGFIHVDDMVRDLKHAGSLLLL